MIANNTISSIRAIHNATISSDMRLSVGTLHLRRDILDTQLFVTVEQAELKHPTNALVKAKTLFREGINRIETFTCRVKNLFTPCTGRPSINPVRVTQSILQLVQKDDFVPSLQRVYHQSLGGKLPVSNGPRDFFIRRLSRLQQRFTGPTSQRTQAQKNRINTLFDQTRAVLDLKLPHQVHNRSIVGQLLYKKAPA
ncbi:MAG: hypothetical protein S4CHLAM102_06190 [Chlamydiia bacterium]|nr:hypothetical protein [Chlamydiia bacterium]